MPKLRIIRTGTKAVAMAATLSFVGTGPGWRRLWEPPPPTTASCCQPARRQTHPCPAPPPTACQVILTPSQSSNKFSTLN